MTQESKKRWIIFSIIWAGAFAVTIWNAYRIDEIIKTGQANERIRMNSQFIKFSSSKISEVVDRSKLLYHNVESENMGLLLVTDQLENLALDYGFEGFQIKNNKSGTRGGTVSILLHFRAPLEKAIHFLKTLQNKYPYLPVKKVLLSVNKPDQPIQFNIDLAYRYTITFQEREG